MTNIVELKSRARKLEEEVKELEKQKAQSEGKLDALFEQLKKDFKVNTLEEAEELSKQLDEKITKLEKEKSKLEESLEAIMNDKSEEE